MNRVATGACAELTRQSRAALLWMRIVACDGLHSPQAVVWGYVARLLVKRFLPVTPLPTLGRTQAAWMGYSGPSVTVLLSQQGVQKLRRPNGIWSNLQTPPGRTLSAPAGHRTTESLQARLPVHVELGPRLVPCGSASDRRRPAASALCAASGTRAAKGTRTGIDAALRATGGCSACGLVPESQPDCRAEGGARCRTRTPRSCGSTE